MTRQFGVDSRIPTNDNNTVKEVITRVNVTGTPVSREFRRRNNADEHVVNTLSGGI